MIGEIWAELSAYSIPEIVAVLASLSYTLLAARENRACWPAAFIGSSIYVVVFWQYKLYMDSALNVYYVAMAVYGWICWRPAIAQDLAASVQAKTISPPIIQWQLATHIRWLFVITLLSLASGYILSERTDAAFPYLDSLTTWSSLLATWMIANKVIESWLYWIAIDFVSMLLYINKELYFTALLFGMYVFIVIYAYWHWRALLQAQQHAQHTLEAASAEK